MDKNYLQDVVPPAQKRSIRNIPLPNRGNKDEKIPEEKPANIISDDGRQEPPNMGNDNPFDDINEKPQKKSKKVLIVVSIIIVLLLLIFFVMSSLHKATISITPKTEVETFEQEILIEDFAEREKDESLGYRTIELSQEVSKEVVAIDEEPVQEKASGDITVFNEYSTNSQKLIGNTRFESSDGRIYRIENSIEVPGYTENDNGSKTPGQITVTVYADEIGEDYNLESDNFTIPGFEGQEPYDFFYAKSATAINGGFDGIRKIVSEEDIEKASAELEQELKNKLISELNDQITDEFYTYYEGEDSFVFDNLTQEQVNDSDNVKLIMRGRILAKIFNKVDISNTLASKLFNNYFTSEDTLISNFESLSIDLSGLEDSEDEEEETGMGEEYLDISGDNIEFVWQINQNQLKKDLLEVDKKSLSTIMKDYTEVRTAEASIKPFWKSTFPNKDTDIKIDIVK